MAYNHEYPYVDPNRYNSDWILNKMKELEGEMNTFEALNKITFSGEWDITKQYPAWTVVNANDGRDGYISIRPVPAGVTIDNIDYWRSVANYSDLIADLQNRIMEITHKRIYAKTLDLILNDSSDAAKTHNTEAIQDALDSSGIGTILDFNVGEDKVYFNTVNIGYGMDNITITGGILAGSFKVLGNGQSRSQVVFYPNFLDCTFIFDSDDVTSDAIQAQFVYMMNVKNCNFRYGNAGIHILDSNDTGGSPRCQFEGNTFEFMNYAILAEETHVSGQYNKSMSDPEIKNNIFVECKTGGVRLEDIDGCTLEGNTFYNCMRAFYVSESPYLKIVGNTFFEPRYYNIYAYNCGVGIISNNQIQGSGALDTNHEYAAIIIEGYGQFSGGKTGMIISENFISHNRNDAILLKSANQVTVHDNMYYPEGSEAQTFLVLNAVSGYSCYDNQVYMDTIDYTTHKFVRQDVASYPASTRDAKMGSQIYTGYITGDGTSGWHTTTITFGKGFVSTPMLRIQNLNAQDMKLLSYTTANANSVTVGFYGTLANGFQLVFLVEAFGVS